jgi:hypothetical protein
VTGPYAGRVLRLLDARSGCYARVRPGRPGLLRVGAHLQPGTGEHDRTGVRVLLIADLLTRAAELRGLQVIIAAVLPGEPPAEQGYAESAAGVLGIHPPAARASAAQASAALGGPVDVHIAGPGRADDQLCGLVTRAGAVHVCTAGSGERGPLAVGAAAADRDPLAVRLALMSRAHDDSAEIDDSVLAGAGEMTVQWRNQVADWAESPSRPMPAAVRTPLDAAFGDLDMPRALQLLADLAREAGAPDGARFETFAFADRVLGLELARYIGRPRR